MKLNRGGLKLCAAYVIFIILIWTLAYFTADPKGRFFFVSLAWFPVGIIFAILHLFPLMYANPWMNTPFFLFPMALLIVYLIGWAISAIKGKIARRKLKAEAAALEKAMKASDTDLKLLIHE